MGEQLGTVIAALIGFGGLFVGLSVGRRQVADQAQVEHGHWLRAQRQEVYVQLLDSWETAVRKTEEVVGDEDYLTAEERGWDWGEDVEPVIMRRVEEAWEPVWRAVERVLLIGPDLASASATTLRTAGQEIVDVALDFNGRWPTSSPSALPSSKGRRLGEQSLQLQHRSCRRLQGQAAVEGCQDARMVRSSWHSDLLPVWAAADRTHRVPGLDRHHRKPAPAARPAEPTPAGATRTTPDISHATRL